MEEKKSKHLVETFVTTFYLFWCVRVHMCVCVCVREMQHGYVESRRHLVGVGFLLPPSRSWELNSGHSVWQKAPFSGEPSH